MEHRSSDEAGPALGGIPAARVDEVLTAMVDLTVSVGEDGTVQSVTETGTEEFDLLSSDVVGDPVGSLFAADAPASPMFDAATASEFERAVLDNGVETVAVPITTGTGRVPVSFTTIPNQESGGWLCVGRDLRPDVSRLQEHQPGVLDSVADPLYVLDADGCVERVNDAFVGYTGYERAELRGREVTDLLLPESDTWTASDHDSGANTNVFEATLVTRDGEQILTEAHVTELTGETGNDAGTVGVLRDIRERTRREQNLNLLKQVMTRVFRHNVRNELTVAKSHASLLDEQTGEETSTHTDEIREATNRLLAHAEKIRLIEQVVETESRSPVDVTECVSSVVDDIREAHPTATVDIDLPPDAVVQAHPNVERAIEELVENAVEHAPPTTDPSIDIWLDRRDGTQTLFVEDESGGLADAEINVLKRGTEHDLAHSSGVGLWLVRWLVEYSGAEMIIHRTDEGSLMGIQFESQADRTERIDVSPLTRAPEHVREPSPEQFDGDTVIGRVGAVGTLEDAYEQLERTGGHSVLVTGEAGIGKTTLVDQFCDRLKTREEPPIVARGVCRQAVRPPYHAFRQLAEGLPAELSELFEETVSAGTDELQKRKQALFADVADELRAVATERPVVLVVEDMHWADSGTIDLFEYLIDDVGSWGYPVLFIGTYRTSDVERTHRVLETAAETETAGRGTVLELEPFSRREVSSLVSSILDAEIPDTLADAIYDHTGGTPLFVTELARQLTETLDLVQTGADLPTDLADVTVPATVERAIADRLAVLPESVQPVLQLGAVAGTEVSFDVLRDASDLPVDALIDRIDTLVRRDIWTRSADGIEFVHGVVREQTLESVEEDDAQRLHKTIAAAIERVHSDALDEYAGQLATHYEQIRDYEAAFAYYRRAGAYAADTYAVEDAVESYEQAISLATTHGIADDRTVAEIYADLAKVREKSGAYETALDATAAGRDLAPEGSPQQCRLLQRQTTIHLEQSDLEETAELGEACLELAETLGDDGARCEVTNSLGQVAEYRGEYDKAAEYYRQALEIADAVDDQSQVGTALHNLGVVAHRRGEYEQAREHLKRSLTIKEGDRFSEKAILNDLGLVAMNRGEYDEAREYYERSLDIASAIGDRRGEAIAVHNLGEIAQNRGEYDEAREYYERSLAIERDLGNQRGEAVSLEFLGQVALERGDDERARQCYEQCLSIGAGLDSKDLEAGGRHGLGVLAREHEEYDRANTHLHRALELREDCNERHNVVKSCLELARLALDRGNLDTAREHARRARTTATEIGATHTAGKSDRVLGRIARAAGGSDQARDHWTDALELFQEVDAVHDELETLRGLVEVCRNQGDSQAAREYSEQAESAVSEAPDAVKRRQQEWIERLETER